MTFELRKSLAISSESKTATKPKVEKSGLMENPFPLPVPKGLKKLNYLPIGNFNKFSKLINFNISIYNT